MCDSSSASLYHNVHVIAPFAKGTNRQFLNFSII
jgi:hypothetical protein